MRNRIQLLIAPLLLVAQVAHTLPVSAAGSDPAQTVPETLNQNVTLNILSPDPVTSAKAQPDFASDVTLPLQAAQAKAAAEAAAQAAAAAAAAKAAKAARVIKASATRAAAVIGPVTGDVWYRLRLCESGNNYARNSGNGYFGAYQYNLGTWANFMGYARPDLAPPAVQDAKAQQTQAARGWSPWPACSRKLGLR